MFNKTIEALRTAEEAITGDLNALWIPFDPVTGGGGVHWHAAGASILDNARTGISNLRSDLEKRQAAADAVSAQPAPAAVVEEVPVISGGSTDDPTPTPDPTPVPDPTPEPTPDPEPTPAPEVSDGA